jgi:hypothetical protein
LFEKQSWTLVTSITFSSKAVFLFFSGGSIILSNNTRPGRIRTIKPEFWTDGTMSRLAEPTALFFIGLWNFSDDYGFFKFDSRELSLLMPRFRPQAIQKMLSALLVRGLIRACTQLEVGQITNWDHQKIKDRRASKWNGVNISWDELILDAPTPPKKEPVSDRIVPDRKGSELRKGQQAELIPADASRSGKTPPPNSREIIALYCDEWKARYKAAKSPPIRGKEAGQLTKFIIDLGEPRVREIITAYFQMPDAWFVTKSHDITTMLASLNKITHFISTGQMVTRSDIRNLEKTVDVKNTIEALERGEI